MAKLDKQTVEWQQKYNKLKQTAKNIEDILLSFHVLLDNLARKRNDKDQLRILKGPLLSPTRRKLIKLRDEFESLESNLAAAYSFFNRFTREPNRKNYDYNDWSILSTLYDNYKHKDGYWDKNKNKAIVYKNNLLAKLTPDDNGRFYNEIKRSANVAQEDINALKKEVDGFLAIIRVLKQ